MQVNASTPDSDSKPDALNETEKADEQEAVQPAEEEKASQENPKPTDYQHQLFPLISFIRKDEENANVARSNMCPDLEESIWLI